jgi:hypothetical protein
VNTVGGYNCSPFVYLNSLSVNTTSAAGTSVSTIPPFLLSTAVSANTFSVKMYVGTYSTSTLRLAYGPNPNLLFVVTPAQFTPGGSRNATFVGILGPGAGVSLNLYLLNGTDAGTTTGGVVLAVVPNMFTTPAPTLTNRTLYLPDVPFSTKSSALIASSGVATYISMDGTDLLADLSLASLIAVSYGARNATSSAIGRLRFPCTPIDAVRSSATTIVCRLADFSL